MAYTAPKTWTAAVLSVADMNTHVRDNLIALRAGGLVFLDSGSGTDTNAGATTVDTVAITGLTALDTLIVEFGLRSVTQTTAAPSLYHVTDAVTLGPLSAALTAGDRTIGTSKLRQLQHANTAVFHLAATSELATGDVIGNSLLTTATTAWTGSWTLGLRHNGVTAGGTFQYSWAVYKLMGQAT